MKQYSRGLFLYFLQNFLPINHIASCFSDRVLEPIVLYRDIYTYCFAILLSKGLLYNHPLGDIGSHSFHLVHPEPPTLDVDAQTAPSDP